MNFFQRDKIKNGLTQLLDDNPNSDVREVLANPDLSMTIRYECPQLIDYVTKPDVLKELLKFVLTREYDEVADSEKLVRSAMVCLSTISKQIQEKLQDDPVFIKALQNCQKNDLWKDLQICGHFQRIVEVYVQHTNGGFLDHFPNISSFLIKYSNILALRGLLLRLLTDFSDAFSEDDYNSIAIEISTSVNGPNAYFLVALMRNIFKEKKACMAPFKNETVLRNLMKAVVDPPKITHTTLFQAECFQVIETLTKEYQEAQPIIKEYASQFTFDKTNITCSTIAALRIFRHGLESLISQFFKIKSPTILNSLILEQIKSMSDDQLTKFVEKNKIIPNLLKAYKDNLINGHLIELANYLNSKTNIDSPSFQKKQWKDFAKNELQKAAEIRVVAKTPDSKPESMPMRHNSIPSWTSFNSKSGGGSIFEMANAQCITSITGKSNALSKYDEDEDEEDEDPPSMGLGDLLGGGGASNEKKEDEGGGFELSLGSLLGDSSSSSSSVPYSGLPTGSGIMNKSGHSFTIPTVYQAEVNHQPMFC